MPYKPKEFLKKLATKGGNLTKNLKRFADGVVSQSDDFFKRTFEVENDTLEVYSYLNVPCEVFEKLNAHELRGLTFVKNSKGETKHFLSLHKFFNIGECKEYKLQNLKGLKLLGVYEKMDGTLIQPVEVGGRIILKTKAEVNSELLKEATELFNSKGLDKMVKHLWDEGLQPLFEFVSLKYQQVVKYERPELYLLQVRNNTTGEYLPFEELQRLGEKFNVKTPKAFDWNLETLQKKARNLKNLEGWVLRFEGDTFAKLKTRWYLKHHGELSNFSEEKALRYALRGKLDDLLPLLSPASEKRKIAERIAEALRRYLNETVEKIYKSRAERGIEEFEFIKRKCRGTKDEKLCIRRELVGYLLRKTSSREGLREVLKCILCYKN